MGGGEKSVVGDCWGGAILGSGGSLVQGNLPGVYGEDPILDSY